MLISEIVAGVARQESLWYVVAAFLIGAFLWTLAEYNSHRFIFHFPAKTPRQERIVYMFHGVHHHQPQCKTRLVLPPVVSIPGLAIFFGLFYVILGPLLHHPHWIRPMISGFALGYLAYDLIHYSTHHFPMRSGVGRYLKRYHMLHHYKTPNQRFGVSSPLWDIVYGTKPAE